jgi:ADP-ribosylglycohydrolase
LITEETIRGGFFGQGIGDALGVPVEFKSRDYLSGNPITDYVGYLCWDQPPGTFSDDSSMMYCTAESLCNGYNIDDIAAKFVRWYKEGYWGAHDKLFDIGGTTKRSLERIFKGDSPRFSGEFFSENNGNGSLMRILPLVFYLLKEECSEVRYNKIKEVSSITHAHFRSVMSCFIYVEFGRQLILTDTKEEAYQKMQLIVNSFISKNEFNPTEIELFCKLLDNNISDYPESSISSNGYVLDSLESSIWCLMTTSDYKESVLKAVNLGGDTDTTAAINGGIAGIYYQYSQIPIKWINELAKTKKILELSTGFEHSLNK